MNTTMFLHITVVELTLMRLFLTLSPHVAINYIRFTFEGIFFLFLITLQPLTVNCTKEWWRRRLWASLNVMKTSKPHLVCNHRNSGCKNEDSNSHHPLLQYIITQACSHWLDWQTHPSPNTRKHFQLCPLKTPFKHWVCLKGLMFQWHPHRV